MSQPPEPSSVPPGWNAETLRALTDHAADILSLLDGSGRLVYNSAAAQRISGFSADELAGADTFALMHPDDRPAVAAAFGRVLASPGATVTVEYRYRTKAGGWTWMEAVATNHLDNPAVRAVVANSRDITARKRAEEERARELAVALHRQRLESLGTLAGGVAHEFNNLLSALEAHVTLAEDATSEPPVRAELSDARAAIQRAAELVRQLLDFARQDPSADGPAVDLGGAVARLLPTLRRVLGGRVRVELAGRADAPLWVRIGGGALTQVVLNLATNARDAMPGGGVLRLDCGRAPAGPGEPPGDVAQLRLADEGEGIAPELLERVFEPFFTTKAPGRGTGLGLAVSHGLVAQAGGTLRLESARGRGTTAVLRLPLLAAPEACADGVPGPSSPRHVGARPGERILLADDDELVRAATRRLLVRLGWEVTEARDGEEAVERVAAAPGAHAAALLDVRMPRLDGVAAARRIASLAPDLPVLLVSGFAAEGGPEILPKPLDRATLAGRLRAIIDAAAARRPA